MAFVKRRRIDAKEYKNQLNESYKLRQSLKVISKSNDQLKHLNGLNKIKNQANEQLKDFKLLSDPKWMEKFLNGEVDPYHYVSEKSHNLVDFVCSRPIDKRGSRRSQLSEVFGTRRLLTNNILKEKLFESKSFNKVFSSQWLNDQQVIFGTKCNKLIVLDVLKQKQHLIPTLKSSVNMKGQENSCGIHAIEINPSRTLLATGGHNPNDVAVYRLPTLDPVCVGEGAHSDWIFDLTWLDDQFLISGSRDTTLALWRFDQSNDSLERVTDLSAPAYSYTKPLMIKFCKNAEKIRALLFNQNNEEVAVLSLNAQIHLFDCQTLKQKRSTLLPYCLENVCLSQQTDGSVYAVGSKSHVSLLDVKTLIPINKILSKNQGTGIRSLSFHNELLTIGTGVGTVLFYDIRANKYLDNSSNNSDHCFLKTSKGNLMTANLFPEELFSDIFFQSEYWPAIYTHQFDSSRTRLFVAGGPLPASLQGSYAALWK